MAGIAEKNASGTFYWVAYPSIVMDETSFIQRCAKCHVTGWDPDTQSWPEKDTNPGKFLNVQCEVCHGADTMSLPDEQRINYSSAVCGQCHTQYGDWQISAHNNSLDDLLAQPYAQDTCLSCMSSQGFVEEEPVYLNTTGLESVTCAACHDPHSEEHEYQLRFKNSTELCGQCHTGSHHPQYDVFLEGPHDMAGVECASCHGKGTRLFHGDEEPWFNHTFRIYNTFYPFNQTEPIVCSSCHTQSWATSQLGVIQGLTTEFITNVTQAIDDAKAAVTVANQTSGVNETKIDEAMSKVETAEGYVHYMENDGSQGFHNPEKTFKILSTAAHLASEAESTALEARATALASEATTLKAQVSSLQNQVTSLQNQTTTLQQDIANLEAKIDDLESTTATAPYLYGGIGLAIGFIIGAIIIFAVRRRKP